MALALYLAMTAAEFHNCDRLPEHPAWMACHFSPYGKGLSNLPGQLPPGSALILNDRVPPLGHDPSLVATQLVQTAEEMSAERILLDLQRPGCPLTAAVVRAVAETTPCPVCVTPAYIADGCSVFLTPTLNQPLVEQLNAWPGRQVWLDAALESRDFCITKDGCQVRQGPETAPEGIVHTDNALHCRYQLTLEDSCARFTLWRDPGLLEALLAEADHLGVTCAVGLYQQLSPLSVKLPP